MHYSIRTHCTWLVLLPLLAPHSEHALQHTYTLYMVYVTSPARPIVGLASYPGPFSCAIRASFSLYARIAHEKGPGYEAIVGYALEICETITQYVDLLLNFFVDLIIVSLSLSGRCFLFQFHNPTPPPPPPPPPPSYSLL